MKPHHLRTHPSAENLPREHQLAWRIAQVAADPVPVEGEVAVVGQRADGTVFAYANLRGHWGAGQRILTGASGYVLMA